MSKIILTKSFTREHSLFYAYVWNKSDTLGLSKWCGVSPNSLFMGEGRGKKLSVWYQKQELDMFLENIEKNLLADPTYFQRARDEFYLYWDKLLPFIKKEKRIETVQDLEYFYDVFVKWWSPMAVIMYIPETKNTSEEARAEALRIRESTQHYSDDGDKLYLEFFNTKFPEYTDVAYVLKLDELFILKARKFTEEELAEIRKRLDGYLVNRQRTFLKKDLEKVLADNDFELEKTDTENVKEIKGTPASGGKAKGKVRLIVYKEQISDLVEGEILVTEMTAPDFVPAMQKAAAIVTDEGGITCHAAIVSREMKKPCVIGTKIATEVLHDGDQVEVDADKGTIKILQTSKRP